MLRNRQTDSLPQTTDRIRSPRSRFVRTAAAVTAGATLLGAGLRVSAEFQDEEGITGAATATEPAERLRFKPGATLLETANESEGIVRPEDIVSAECAYTANTLFNQYFFNVFVTIEGFDPDPTPKDGSIDGGSVVGEFIYDDLGIKDDFVINADNLGLVEIGSFSPYPPDPSSIELMQSWSGEIEFFKYDAFEFDVEESEVGFSRIRLVIPSCRDVTPD